MKSVEKYGMLTLIGKDTTKDSRYYLFKCDCGNVKSIILYNVKRGATTSCGCKHKQMLVNGEMHRIHGGRGTRLYHIWKSMRERCNNPNTNRHQSYKDKGIKICDEWNDFSNFRTWAYENGYQDNLTIDRKDTNGNYEPSNCRWATYKEQANNRTNNRVIEYDGKKLTLAQWSGFLGINADTLWVRLKRGWSIEKTFTTPVSRY